MEHFHTPIISENDDKFVHAGLYTVNNYQIDKTDFHNRILCELVDSIRDDIFRLTELSDGWDGHDGIPVKTEIAYFAIQIIKEIVCLNMPKPSVVPGSDGTLQLEWHKNGFDIEIDIFEPKKVIAERIDLVRKTESEINITDDFSKLSDWIMELADDRRVEKINMSGDWITDDQVDSLNKPFIDPGHFILGHQVENGDTFVFGETPEEDGIFQREYAYRYV